MPAIQNRNHEKFAQAISKNPKEPPSKIYKDIYQTKAPTSHIVNASKLKNDTNVKERVKEILNEKGLDLHSVTDTFSECIHSQNEGIKLNAVTLAYKLHGALEENKTPVNFEKINIVFGDVTP